MDFRRRATCGAVEADLDRGPRQVGDLVQLLDALRGQPQIVAVDARIDLEIERGVAVQQLARLAHQLAEGGDLELRRVVGDDQAHEPGALGDPLLLAGDHPGQPQPAALARDLPQPIAGGDAQPLQRVR